jgi:hypothetical protein
MTILAVQDLGYDEDLDRDAMRTHLGGRGLGRSALFAFPLFSSSQPSPNQTIFNIFADTVQLNQLIQITKIVNSDNVITDQDGDQGNSNFRNLALPAVQ